MVCECLGGLKCRHIVGRCPDDSLPGLWALHCVSPALAQASADAVKGLPSPLAQAAPCVCARRHVAGGSPVERLKARANAASES